MNRFIFLFILPIFLSPKNVLCEDTIYKDSNIIRELKKEQGIIKGERTKHDIMDEIYKSNLKDARFAYNKALRYGSLTGTYVFVKFTILGNGSVDDVEVIKNDFSDSSFVKEIGKIVATWKFNKIKNESDTTLFKFCIKLTQ